MKFLADAKNAKFASDLLSAAGFNLEDLRKAGDVNAIKTAMDFRAKVEGPTAEELDQAVKENQRLETEVTAIKTEATNLKAGAKIHTQVCEALAGNGIKVSEMVGADGLSTEKFDQAFTLAVAKASRTALARAGHTAIEEQVTTVSTKKDRAPAGLTGRDRVRWAFNQQAANGIN